MRRKPLDLLGHLITGFRFLISWRGYWQEMIESLVWVHEQTPIANLIVWADKPVALSIVQARFVGLAHFAIGYVLTYGPFVMASSSAYLSFPDENHDFSIYNIENIEWTAAFPLT